MNILFVCRGNVARSQMGEVLLRKYAKDKHEILSCGTKLGSPELTVIKELGALVDNMIAVMKEEGIDISNNIRTQLTPEMVDWADKIFMITDADDPIPDYLKDSAKTTHWELPNPKGQSLEFYRDVRDKIKQLIMKSGL